MGGRFQIVLRLLAPAAAALALVSVITNDTHLDADLVLIAPERAHKGDLIALRALVYSGLNRPQGPALIHALTRVELIRPGGTAIAATELRPGFGPSLEGQLRVPDDAEGKLTLAAHAWAGGQRIEVERAFAVGEPERAPRAARALGPLQQLAHGPIHTRDGALAPSDLSVRVAGGACVPERPCELFVHVGEPAARLEVVATPSVTVEQAPPQLATSGVVALRIRTHGPEAQLQLRASGQRAQDEAAGLEAAVIEATRAVRLPVALGADAMQLERPVLEPSTLPKLSLLGGEGDAIADVFGEGRWLSSTTQHASVSSPLHIAALPAGLYRVQLRRDPFESDSAALRTIYVRAAGETDGNVLHELATRVVAAERALPIAQRDAFAAQLASGAIAPGELDFEATAGYLLAALDHGVDRLPTPTSGYPLARKRALAHREDVRMLALVVLALAAASLVLLLVQRGLLASEQAALLLRASGTGDADVRRERLRMTLRVLGAALSVLLVFCAIALYLIIRGRAL